MANPLAALIIARSVVPEKVQDRRRGRPQRAEELEPGGREPGRDVPPLRRLRPRRSTAS